MGLSTVRRVTGGAAGTLLIGATFLSTAGLTLGAVPSADRESFAIPAHYSSGNLAGFRATFVNKDTSTISQLYLTANTDGAVPSLSGGTFWATGRIQGLTVDGACTQTSPFQCSFRNVKPNDLVVVEVAFSPSGGSASATFTWTSSGAPSSDGGVGHGYSWSGGTAVATVSADPDYAGGFEITSNGDVSNLQVLSSANLQATRLGNLPAGVVATVHDGPDATGSCSSTPLIKCGSLIGEWSEVTVGDGQTFGSAFTVTISIRNGTPKGFVHSYLDTSSVPAVQTQELIGSCPNPATISGLPCFTWNAKLKQATIFTFHNGSYRGQ